MQVYDYQITIAPKNGFKHGLKNSNKSPPTSIKFIALIIFTKPNLSLKYMYTYYE